MDARQQAKLYYLYMMSDGKISDKEKIIFNEICKDLCLDADDKKRIKDDCKKIVDKEKKTCIDVINQNIEEEINQNIEEEWFFGPYDIGLGDFISEKDKAKILWNLINLGYSDSYYTIEEQEVVNCIKKYWEISDVLYQEMIDVAETMLALEKKKNWVEKFSESDNREEKIKQIKKDIKNIHKNILRASLKTFKKSLVTLYKIQKNFLYLEHEKCTSKYL